MAEYMHLWLRGYAVERLISYMVALMVYTSFIAVVGATSVQFFVHKWQTSVVGHMVIEVVFPSQEVTTKERDQVVQRLRKNLDALPEVSQYRFVVASGLDVGGLAPEAFVEPVFVDVTVRPKSISAEGLQRSLASIHPLLRVKGAGRESMRASRLMGLAELGALALLGLIVLGGVGVVAFASQASLMINRKVVSMMFLMGATATYIVRQFQRHIFRLAGFGALMGLCGIVLTLLAVYGFFRYNGFVHYFLFDGSLIFLLVAGTPLFFVVFMVLSVDVAVRRSISMSDLNAVDW